MKQELVDKVRRDAAARRRGVSNSEADMPWSCSEVPPTLLHEAIEQFNRGEYFRQHETLEELWIAEPRPLRRLYQGILKIGVGFYKLRLGNYRGTVNHITGGIEYLKRFEDNCLGVDVARLIADAHDVHSTVVDLGPERLAEFDLGTLPRVHYTHEGPGS
ncbi:MAG: DUF309 domain-containing protein [Chloroflexota bacterium]|nr:DUF309 domain-containing protein [Chloroflexota bacterium]